MLDQPSFLGAVTLRIFVSIVGFFTGAVKFHVLTRIFSFVGINLLIIGSVQPRPILEFIGARARAGEEASRECISRARLVFGFSLLY